MDLTYGRNRKNCSNTQTLAFSLSKDMHRIGRFRYRICAELPFEMLSKFTFHMPAQNCCEQLDL